ncbi:MAG TPA: hypothetical protein VE521_07915 [Nitrososphaera sp.]|jgi:hypothetical protein|nr:hypothetical protein [Nitrososphaera sp.]
MSSGYSEEDIRRAAEIREWLIKEISDKQEEVERLRTTLSIIDNLLKQGSFKAAANLGFAAAATTPTPAGPTTSSSSSTTAQIQQQTRQTPAPPPQEQSPAAKRQQQQQAGAAAPTLRATADNNIRDSGDNNSRNIKPLKRAKDDFLLANAEISQDAVVIVPAPGVNLNANTPPFKSFFLNRILEGMKNKDAEKVSQGALSESDSLNYKVEEEDDSGGNSGIIKRIVINKYREKDRLQEIFNTSAWVFTRMLEKSGR